jgi:hypothetical protein
MGAVGPVAMRDDEGAGRQRYRVAWGRHQAARVPGGDGARSATMRTGFMMMGGEGGGRRRLGRSHVWWRLNGGRREKKRAWWFLKSCGH